MPELAQRALEACVEYEHCAAEVTRLTSAIGQVECPRETHDDVVDGKFVPGTPSCFQRVRTEMRPTGPLPDDGPRPVNLAEIGTLVADCPECSRLVNLIGERRGMRQRFGKAKRAIRHLGKKGPSAEADFFDLARDEMHRAQALHGRRYSTLHEGFGVLVEEGAELFEIVRQKRDERDPGHLLIELLQIAAVAGKTAFSVGAMAALDMPCTLKERAR